MTLDKELGICSEKQPIICSIKENRAIINNNCACVQGYSEDG